MPSIESTSSAQVSGVIAVEVRDAATGALIPEESCVVHNIVTDVGLAELARIVNGDPLLTAVGWEIGVGTSSTAAAAGDTALGAQVLRDDITSRARSGTAIAFKFFIDTTQANGSTLAEAGLFHDGVLVDRAILSPTVAKTSAKVVTVTVTLTLSR